MMNQFDAVILDVDGTITRSVSWTALTAGLGANVNDHLALYHDYRDDVITYEESKRQLIDLWRASGKANRKTLEKLFRRPPFRAGTYVLLKWLRRRGLRVCIISGAVDLYVDIVADRLKVHDRYANCELVFDDDGWLVDYHYRLDQAAMKLEQLREFCEKYSLDERNVLVIGDSENDGELFRVTGHGVLVAGRGEDQADLEPWRVVRKLVEIPPIIAAA